MAPPDLILDFRHTVVVEIAVSFFGNTLLEGHRVVLASVPQPNVGFTCRPMSSSYSKGLL